MSFSLKSLHLMSAVIMGTSPKGHTYNSMGEGMPLLNGPTEFGDSHPECTLFTNASVRECLPGDLIFCVRGSTTGRMNWADRVYSLGRGVCAIRGEDDLDTRFIRYGLEYRLPALLQLAGGSTFPNLPQDTIKNFEIPFPRNRQRIASILSAYDEAMENNRRRMGLLENAARLLYEGWFVRLRFPGHEHTPVIKGLPKGWERVTTPDAIEINPTTKLSDEVEHWYVEMADLPTDSMVIQSAIKREGRSGSKFQNGDTLLARITPCLENGKTGFVNFMADGERGRGSTEFIVLRSKRVTPEFVYCLARTYNFRENAIKSMVGSSGRQRVQESCFEKFQVLVPPKLLLNLFSESAEPIFRQIRVLHLQNQKLRAARDLLLPRLMSGEIEV